MGILSKKIIIASAVVLGICLCGQAQETSENMTIEQKAIEAVNKIKDRERFQISAWGGGYGTQHLDGYYQSLQDAGFTTITGAYEYELNRAAKHGLNVQIHIPELSPNLTKPINEEDIRAKFKAVYERIGKHPAVNGYSLRDEPNVNYFENLNKIKNIIRELDAEHECYINLYPNYANEQQMGVPTYEEYAEEFAKQLSPDWIGYDHYAIYNDNAAMVPDRYWNNMNIIRNVAQKYGLNFRFILLSVGHFNYRVPTKADLNFQAFSAIAYGAKCIEYFTYATPCIGNYHDAPLDYFGEKTQTWYNAAYVNKKIQVYAPILNRLISTKVYHFSATGKVLEGMEAPEDSLLTVNPARETLVGEFKHADTGEQYIMIVNKNLHDPCPLTIKLREPDKWIVQRVSPAAKGALYDFVGEQLWIGNGEEHLLKLVPRN